MTYEDHLAVVAGDAMPAVGDTTDLEVDQASDEFVH
jgi:hypothetical protein